MAVTKATITGHKGEGVKINDIQVLGEQVAAIASLTDSTTGTAGDTVDDNTASVKDDIASLAAKINAILAALRSHGIIAT